MLEAFLDDFRLVGLVAVICVVLLWYNLKILANVLSNPSYGKVRHVLVTGCDSGFGYEIALNLSECKCKVFAGCLTQDGVDKMTNVKDFDGVPFLFDVRKDEDVEKARKMIDEETKGNGLMAVINNAGINQHGLLEWQSIESMQNVMDVNFWGMVRVIKSVLPMLKICKGRIINMSSMAGRVSLPNSGVYPVTKFAIEAFSDSLRYELKPWGVTVHLIEPMIYATEIASPANVRRQWLDLFNKQSEETQKAYQETFFSSLETSVEKLYKKASPNLHEVVEKVQHAVLSSNPKIRYPVGSQAMLARILSILPTSTSDWIKETLFFIIFKPKTLLDVKKSN